MGGGLACLSFVDINQAGIFPTVDVISFGAPRVGNKKWAEYVDELTGYDARRVDIKGDPIPGMPTCLTLLCNYGHIGYKIECDLDTEICTQEERDGERETFMESVKRKREYYDTTDSVGSIIDHIEGYPKIYNFTLKVPAWFIKYMFFSSY